MEKHDYGGVYSKDIPENGRRQQNFSLLARIHMSLK